MKYRIEKGCDHCEWWVRNPSGFAIYVGQTWEDAMGWLDGYLNRRYGLAGTR